MRRPFDHLLKEMDRLLRKGGPPRVEPGTWIDLQTAATRYDIPVQVIRRWCLGDKNQKAIPTIVYRTQEIQRKGARPYRRWLIDESTLQPVVDAYRKTGRGTSACVA